MSKKPSERTVALVGVGAAVLIFATLMSSQEPEKAAIASSEIDRGDRTDKSAPARPATGRKAGGRDEMCRALAATLIHSHEQIEIVRAEAVSRAAQCAPKYVIAAYGMNAKAQ